MATSSTVASFLTMAVVAMAALQAAGATPPPPPPPPPPPSYFMPTYCSATLYQLYQCVPFLTIGTVSGPPANCCASLREVLSTPASICLCHAIGRELNEFLHINIDPIRLALLPIACWAIVPPQLPAMCVVGPVPPIYIIPNAPSSPPPPVTPPPSPPMRLLP